MNRPEQADPQKRPVGRPPKRRRYERPHTSLLVSCKGVGKRWRRGDRLTVGQDIDAEDAHRRVELGQMIWLDGLSPSEICQWLELSAHLRSREVPNLEAGRKMMDIYDLLTREERDRMKEEG